MTKRFRYDGQDMMCVSCGGQTTNHPDGRPRIYCSNACRQREYRERQGFKKRHPGAKGWWE